MEDAHELQRLADFNGQPMQAQRRWTPPRTRRNSLPGTPPHGQSPRGLADPEQLDRLATASASATVTQQVDQLQVDTERALDKVGVLGTKHQLLAEEVQALQNQVTSLEQRLGSGNACCVLY